MKNLINWVAGFFSSDSNNSSKRLVGIVGAGVLYYTLYSNYKSGSNVEHSEQLVWATTILIMTSLGLTTVEAVTGLLKEIKKDKKEE
jgi:hypothetical protein